MDTTNFSLPDTLKDFVLMRVSEGGYGSVSEYVGELVRADQKQKALALVEVEVLEGIRSRPAEPMTEKDWADLRSRARSRGEEAK